MDFFLTKGLLVVSCIIMTQSMIWFPSFYTHMQLNKDISTYLEDVTDGALATQDGSEDGQCTMLIVGVLISEGEFDLTIDENE